MRIRIREVFLKKTLRIFAILNVILLLWAVGVIVYTVLAHIHSNKISLFIRKEVGFDSIGLVSIVVSSAVVILCAFIGLLGAFFHFPLIFNSYRSFFGGSISLKGFAVIWAALLHPAPFLSKYVQLFKMESLFFEKRAEMSGMWNRTGILWDTVQNELECCSVNDFKDWIHSPCKCVPLSCCKTNSQTFSTCKKLVHNQTFQDLDAQQIKTLTRVTWDKNCIWALREGMTQLQESLIEFSLGILFFELGFYTLAIHLLKLIEHHVKKVKREESDFDGKFGIWMLEPSDTDFGGLSPLQPIQPPTKSQTTLNDHKNITADLDFIHKSPALQQEIPNENRDQNQKDESDKMNTNENEPTQTH